MVSYSFGEEWQVQEGFGVEIILTCYGKASFGEDRIGWAWIGYHIPELCQGGERQGAAKQGFIFQGGEC